MLLDTHVLVWLHVGALDRFNPAARAMLEDEPLRTSPASLLELTYLHEIGRTGGGADEVVAHLAGTIGLQVAELRSTTLFRAAATMTWTRDPFDRLIAGHAHAVDEPLLTSDSQILEHLPVAIWP